MTGTPTFRVFLSAVTSEFGLARSALASDLRTRGLEVWVQDDFRQEAEAFQYIDDYGGREGLSVSTK